MAIVKLPNKLILNGKFPLKKAKFAILMGRLHRVEKLPYTQCLKQNLVLYCEIVQVLKTRGSPVPYQDFIDMINSSLVSVHRWCPTLFG